MAGWWFEPLCKILVSWGYYSQYFFSGTYNPQRFSFSDQPVLPREIDLSASTQSSMHLVA